MRLKTEQLTCCRSSARPLPVIPNAGFGLTAIILSVAFLCLSYLSGWPLGVILIGPSLSAFWMGVAYLRNQPSMLGKLPTGSFRVGHLLGNFPFFLLAWCTWHLAQRLSQENPVDQVSPTLLIGRRLLDRKTLPADCLVVDLTSEFRELSAITEGAYFFFPILDGHVPSDQALLHAVQKIGQYAGPVYIHCAQGHGRTALVATAFLIASGKASSVLDASVELKSVRPGIRLSPSQRSQLERLEPDLLKLA